MMMFKKRGPFLGLFSLPAVVPLWSSLPLNKPATAPQPLSYPCTGLSETLDSQ